MEQNCNHWTFNNHTLMQVNQHPITGFSSEPTIKDLFFMAPQKKKEIFDAVIENNKWNKHHKIEANSPEGRILWGYGTANRTLEQYEKNQVIDFAALIIHYCDILPEYAYEVYGEPEYVYPIIKEVFSKEENYEGKSGDYVLRLIVQSISEKAGVGLSEADFELYIEKIMKTVRSMLPAEIKTYQDDNKNHNEHDNGEHDNGEHDNGESDIEPQRKKLFTVNI